MKITRTAMTMNERWLPVIGYEGWYEVSDAGRVRSVDRYIEYKDGRKRFYKSQLRTQVDLNGYRGVSLYRAGDEKRENRRFVHQLVLEAFVGPCPPGMECRHLNGVPSDNRLKNLAWGTSKENTADTIRHGRLVRGEQVHNSKLTEIDIHAIRYWRRSGYSGKEVAEIFGIRRAYVYAICNKWKWGWVPNDAACGGA
jgi:hypothetical protein